MSSILWPLSTDHGVFAVPAPEYSSQRALPPSGCKPFKIGNREFGVSAMAISMLLHSSWVQGRTLFPANAYIPNILVNMLQIDACYVGISASVSRQVVIWWHSDPIKQTSDDTRTLDPMVTNSELLACQSMLERVTENIFLLLLLSVPISHDVFETLILIPRRSVDMISAALVTQYVTSSFCYTLHHFWILDSGKQKTLPAKHQSSIAAAQKYIPALARNPVHDFILTLLSKSALYYLIPHSKGLFHLFSLQYAEGAVINAIVSGLITSTSEFYLNRNYLPLKWSYLKRLAAHTLVTVGLFSLDYKSQNFENWRKRVALLVITEIAIASMKTIELSISDNEEIQNQKPGFGPGLGLGSGFV